MAIVDHRVAALDHALGVVGAEGEREAVERRPPGGELVVTAEAARAAAGVRIRFADAAVDATIEDDG